MARWELTAPHYLNCPDTEWESVEDSLTTGKRVRKRFKVPCYLNPKEPADQNYPGTIIVCWDGKGQKRDIIFEGLPTIDMEPLDDEARSVSDEVKSKSVHPIDSLNAVGMDYGSALVATFQQQIDQIINLALAKGERATPAPASNPVSENAVTRDEFTKMQEQLATLMAENAELKARPGRRA